MNRTLSATYCAVQDILSLRVREKMSVSYRFSDRDDTIYRMWLEAQVEVGVKSWVDHDHRLFFWGDDDG